MTTKELKASQKRYQEIIQERYLLAKYCNISYSDSGDIAPSDRKIIMTTYINELQKQKKMRDEIASKQKVKSKGKR